MRRDHARGNVGVVRETPQYNVRDMIKLDHPAGSIRSASDHTHIRRRRLMIRQTGDLTIPRFVVVALTAAWIRPCSSAELYSFREMSITLVDQGSPSPIGWIEALNARIEQVLLESVEAKHSALCCRTFKKTRKYLI
jgi:hypothetical protein